MFLLVENTNITPWFYNPRSDVPHCLCAENTNITPWFYNPRSDVPPVSALKTQTLLHGSITIFASPKMKDIRLFDPLVLVFPGYPSSSYTDMPINHKIFLAQFDTIRKIASEGPCILVGRCADYALEEFDNVLSVFIHADMDARVRRIARIYDLTDAKAKDRIIKTDKKRSSYYNYYSNKKWGAAESYNICLDSSLLGIDGTAKAIEQLVALKETVTDRKL